MAIDVVGHSRLMGEDEAGTALADREGDGALGDRAVGAGRALTS